MMNRKLSKLVRNPVAFFKDSKLFKNNYSKEKKVNEQSEGLFDYVDDQGNNFGKPVVLVFGINVWKRKIVSDFLSEFSVKFVRKNTPWVKIKKEIKNIDVHAFVFWGMMEKRLVSTYAESKSIPIWRLEDGFLRSVGLGSEHILPLSLALDKQGIYFNSSKKSDLEEKILSIELCEEKKERAKKNLEMILDFGLSKYNNKIDDLNLISIDERLINSEKYKILIIGQVEDDASILHGSKIKYKNNDVVHIARKEFPDAEIFYRPHPDVAGGFRKEQSSPADVADICHVVTSNTPINSWIEAVDHVFTITSLTGFEALMRGKKVTVLGAPFYAGWGLSDDRQAVSRRSKNKNLLEVFYAAYIDYPKYNLGFLNNEAQIEHVIFALQLERSGVEKSVAGLIATSFEVEEIDVDLFHRVNSNLKNKFKKSIPEVNWKDFYRSLAEENPDENKLFEELVKYFLTGKYKKSLLNDISSFENLDDLSVIRNFESLSPFLYASERYLEILDVLIKFGDFNSAEKVINQKLNSINLDQDEFFKLLECYKKLYAEQGKFGRKPVSGNELVEFYKRNWQWIIESDKYSQFVYHIIVHCKHYRLQQYISYFLNEIKDEIKNNKNINKSFEIALSASRALMSTPLRPELNMHKYVVAAKDIYECIEVRATVDEYAGINSLPRSMKFYLTEIFLICFNESNYFDKLENIYFDVRKNNLKKEEVSRFKSLVSVDFSIRARARDYKNILNWLSSLSGVLPEEFVLNLSASCHIYLSDYEEAKKITFKLLDKYKKNQYRRKLSQIFENEGKLSISLAWLLSAAKNSKSKNELSGIEKEISRVKFLQRSSDILKNVPQPKIPQGVVFVTSFGCLNSISMMTPVLYELKKNGYAIVQVDEGILVNEPTGIDWIDRHAGSIPRVLHTDAKLELALKNEWIIDWSNKKIISEGINYYQGVFEIMTQRFRSFNFDINDPNVYRWFRHYLIRSDAALSVCKNIRDSVLKKGMPVRFINCGSHSAPFSIYRTFSYENRDKYNIGFIHMGPAYENYYSNLKSKVASTVCLENLTKYPYYRLPFLARPDLFEAWMQQDGLYDKYQVDINKFLNHNRVGKSIDDKSNSFYIDKINLAKSRGAKIICAYGKILCDMAVPFDGGPGHENIVDWLKHTVEVARKSENFFILKPHPHELRPEIARDLNEYWLDNIDRDNLPDNVIILPHNGFNNQDLIPYLDLALLWNGTSSLELCAQGVPVVMASYFGKHDYPIDLIYPESRDDYENILNASSWAVPDRAKMERAALLLKYMGTEEVCIPFKYSYRPVTNDPVGVPYWHDDEINGFLKNGDKFISKMADKFFN